MSANLSPIEGPRTYQSAWQWNDDETAKLMTAEDWLQEEADVDAALDGPTMDVEREDDGPDRGGILRAIAEEVATLRRERSQWAEQCTQQSADLIRLRAENERLARDYVDACEEVTRLRSELSSRSGAGTTLSEETSRESDYRAGYSAGFEHAKNGAKMADEESALLYFNRMPRWTIRVFVATDEAPISDDIEVAAMDEATAVEVAEEQMRCKYESESYVLTERTEVVERPAVDRLSSVATGEEPTRYDQVPNGCWVACIAGITGLSHDEMAALVPKDIDGAEKNSDYNNAVNRYLRTHGWRLAYLGDDAPRGFAIGSGTSPRGVHHAVIVHDGAQWHDPHPSRHGIDNPRHFEVAIPLLRPVEIPPSDPVERREGNT